MKANFPNAGRHPRRTPANRGPALPPRALFDEEPPAQGPHLEPLGGVDEPPSLRAGPGDSRVDPLEHAYVAALQAAANAPRPGEDRTVGAGYGVRPPRRPGHSAQYAVIYGERFGRHRWGPSLHVSPDEPDAESKAEAAFRLWSLQEKGRALGLVSPKAIKIAAVAAHAVREKRPGRHASPRERDSYGQFRRRLERFLKHFPGTTLGEITLSRLTAYCGLRIRDGRMRDAEATTRFVTSETLRLDCEAMKHALNLWRSEHPLGWTPQIKLPKKGGGRERYVRRDEMARLLMACRGYVWDNERGDWRVDPETGRRVRHGPQERLRRKPIARASLIQYLSATRIDAVVGLGWSMHPHTGCIDLTAGLIHRGGYGEIRDEGKPHMTSVITPRPLVHLRAWERNDRQAGIQSLIHKPIGANQRGRQYRGYPYMTWWEVVRDAGLGDDVDPHALCHSCITNLLNDGYDPTTVAGLVGRTPMTILRHYLRWNLVGQRHAVGGGRRPQVKVVLERDDDETRTTRRARRYARNPDDFAHRPPLAERVRRKHGPDRPPRR